MSLSAKMKSLAAQLAPQAPDVLAFEDFTRQFCLEFSSQRSDEKRDAERIELPPIPAEVTSLDDELKATAPPFAAIVRNISSDGIGLMFGKPVESNYLEVRVGTPSGKKLATIVDVKHCTENGFMIGGTALTDLDLS